MLLIWASLNIARSRARHAPANKTLSVFYAFAGAVQSASKFAKQHSHNSASQKVKEQFSKNQIESSSIP